MQRRGPQTCRTPAFHQNSPGVEDGTRIRLTGEGEAGPNGTPSGDLYVVLGIRAHPFFQREGPASIAARPFP